MPRLGSFAVRHATWVIFALIAVAILPGTAGAQHRPPGPVLMAAAQPGPEAGAPVWFTPQALAGMAALVAALGDGVAKVVIAVRRDVSAEACPFAVGGVARCHGSPSPIPPKE